MKTKICLLIISLLLYACTASNYDVIIPKTSISKSFNIWYNDNELDLALLAGFENTQTSGANLGLVFLQGKRFAQCTYANNTVKCSLSSSIKNSKMQKIAEDIALIITHLLASGNALPLQWERINANKGHAFENKLQKSNLRIEEHI